LACFSYQHDIGIITKRVFYVLQGSVETLFRLGGKHCNSVSVVTNIFRHN